MNEGATEFSPRAACEVVRNQIAEVERDMRSAANPQGAVIFRMSTILHLAMARGWLGKCLGTLGATYPYPRSMDSSSPMIEPPAYKKLPDREPSGDAVAQVKKARFDIQNILDSNKGWGFGPRPDGFDRYFALFRTSMESAKMTLGEELGILGGH